VDRDRAASEKEAMLRLRRSAPNPKDGDPARSKFVSHSLYIIFPLCMNIVTK